MRRFGVQQYVLKVLTILLCCVATCNIALAADGVPQAGVQVEQSAGGNVGGKSLRYMLYLPTGYNNTRTWPVLVFLHGAGQRGPTLYEITTDGPPRILRDNSIPMPDLKNNFIVISPQIPYDTFWFDYFANVQSITDSVTTRFNGNRGKTYLTGLSMGGYGTWRIAGNSATRWAAILPVCGGKAPAYGGGTLQEIQQIGTNMPVWTHHGTNDPDVPYSDTVAIVNHLEAQGGTQFQDVQFNYNPKSFLSNSRIFTTHTGAGHDIWTNVYNDPDTYKWLLQWSRSVGAGSGTGLKAEYFSGTNLSTFSSTRIDGTIDFNWGSGAATPALPIDSFSARWTGQVQATDTGSHTFTSYTDDGVRVWVDGRLLIDKWIGQPPTRWSGSINLEAGQRYNIKVEYFESGGGAVAQLFWRHPGQSTDSIIPQSQLCPPIPTPTPYSGSTAPIGRIIGIKALANNLYVSAIDSNTPLKADQGIVGVTEKFLVVNAGNGLIGLQSMGPGKQFVCAENAGDAALIANRPALGIWEQFQWVDLGNGEFGLRAMIKANDNVVCADGMGGNPLIANRPSFGGWERFTALMY